MKRLALALVLVVLQEHVDLPFEKRDVHTVVAGGVRAVEPGVDLAMALALASARDKVPVPGDVVACVVNFGGDSKEWLRVGVPFGGKWRVILDTSGYDQHSTGQCNQTLGSSEALTHVSSPAPLAALETAAHTGMIETANVRDRSWTVGM